MEKRLLSLYVAACLIIPVLAAGQAEVSYSGGLLTVRCNELPLNQVFEQIKTNTGLELILEDSIKATRLTANIEAKPVHMALERLLEGSGVNYAMTFDPQDWTRVTRIFIGGGGDGPSAPAAAQRATTSRRPTRSIPAESAESEDDYEEPEEIMDDGDFGADEFVEEEGPDEGIEPSEEFEEFEEPSEFSPPPPSYPRSPFTPGLEASPFGSSNRRQTQPEAQPQQEAEPDAPPPAYYPFLDREGRPIPVPPGTVPQRQPKKKNP